MNSPLHKAKTLKYEINHKLFVSESTEVKIVRDNVCNPNDICVLMKYSTMTYTWHSQGCFIKILKHFGNYLLQIKM